MSDTASAATYHCHECDEGFGHHDDLQDHLSGGCPTLNYDADLLECMECGAELEPTARVEPRPVVESRLFKCPGCDRGKWLALSEIPDDTQQTGLGGF